MKTIIYNCDRCKDESSCELFAQIEGRTKDEFQGPGDYGRNWEICEDCYRELIDWMRRK